MLTYNVRGENIEVTDAIRAYVEKRISKLNKFFDNSVQAIAHVNLKVYPDKTAKVEVTIPLSYLTLRAEETSLICMPALTWLPTNSNAKCASTRPRSTASPAKKGSPRSKWTQLMKKQSQKTTYKWSARSVFL